MPCVVMSRPVLWKATPGPLNCAHYEHSLLARYLGFPLVEGGDLAVRDGELAQNDQRDCSGLCHSAPTG